MVDDVIMEFNTAEVRDFEDLVNQVQQCSPGREVVLQVRRGEERVRITVVVGRRPD